VRDERYGGFTEKQGGTMLFNSDDCRVNGRGWTPIIARTLLVSAFLLGVTTAINAQPNLVETMVEGGNFKPDTCSGFSPLSQNLPTSPPLNPNDPAFFTVPSSCKNTIMLWVSNTGTAPTDGSPVNVYFTLSPDSRRALTVLSANAYTSAPGNINAGKPNGWACKVGVTFPVTFNTVTCTRSDVLPAGKSYQAIVLSVLPESNGSQPPVYNIYSTVWGGGMLGQNTAFDAVDAFPGTDLCDSIPTGKRQPSKMIPKFFCFDTKLRVQTVPPGLGMNVDGSQVGTPHTFFLTKNTIHTFMEPFNAKIFVSSGLIAQDNSCLAMPEPPIYSTVGPPADDCTFLGNQLVILPNGGIGPKVTLYSFWVEVEQ
jgi:hypothetical protein